MVLTMSYLNKFNEIARSCPVTLLVLSSLDSIVNGMSDAVRVDAVILMLLHDTRLIV